MAKQRREIIEDEEIEDAPIVEEREEEEAPPPLSKVKPAASKRIEELRSGVKPFQPVKKPCPVTMGEFQDAAQPVRMEIDGEFLTANPMVFSTGSFGWNFNGKVTVHVDGVPLRVQVTGNMIVVGSKPEKLSEKK